MNVQINDQAPVKANSQAEIDAPLFSVWNILTNITGWPSWQKAVTKTKVSGDISEGTVFHWKAGGFSFISKIHTSVPYSAFGWTGTTIGVSAIHNRRFEVRDNKTIVTVEESLQGFLPKLFRKYFQKNLEAGILTNLKELKTASESVLK